MQPFGIGLFGWRREVLHSMHKLDHKRCEAQTLVPENSLCKGRRAHDVGFAEEYRNCEYGIGSTLTEVRIRLVDLHWRMESFD